MTQQILATSNSAVPLQIVSSGVTGAGSHILDVGNADGSTDALIIDNNRFATFGRGASFAPNGSGSLTIDAGGAGFTRVIGTGLTVQTSSLDLNLVGSGGGNHVVIDATGGGTVKLKTDQTTVNCSTSGSVVFSQPFGGTGYKKIMIYLNACNGTASYTYPVAFTHAPQILSQTLAATAGSPSTSAVTITGTTHTGFVELDGF